MASWNILCQVYIWSTTILLSLLSFISQCNYRADEPGDHEACPKYLFVWGSDLTGKHKKTFATDMGLVSWNFFWVSRAGKLRWESCAKDHGCFRSERLLAFQALFLLTENCSKNKALISLQLLTAGCEHYKPLPQISTSSSFPPASSHLTGEGGQLQDHLAT